MSIEDTKTNRFHLSCTCVSLNNVKNKSFKFQCDLSRRLDERPRPSCDKKHHAFPARGLDSETHAAVSSGIFLINKTLWFLTKNILLRHNPRGR